MTHPGTAHPPPVTPHPGPAANLGFDSVGTDMFNERERKQYNDVGIYFGPPLMHSPAPHPPARAVQ